MIDGDELRREKRRRSVAAWFWLIATMLAIIALSSEWFMDWLLGG